MSPDISAVAFASDGFTCAVGGDACLRDTRITVWGLVAYRRLDMSDAEIVRAVQGLTPADLEAAWEYAAGHAEEIDEAIRENEEGSLLLPPHGDALMQIAFRTETTVLPGHRLEISAPELPEGARVEVIVILPEKPTPNRISMLELLATLPPGPCLFKTPEEADRYLREERDSWDR